MEPISQDQYELIARHLSGDISAEEEERLTGWLKENPAHQEVYSQLAAVWKSAAPVDDFQPDVNKAWEKVKLKTGWPNQEPAKVISFYSVRTWLRIAAGLIPLVVFALAVKSIWFNKSERKILAAALHKREFILPDSSKVTLNKNSSLVYYDNYNKTNREVFLNGEAFFEVKKDRSRPFIVQGLLSRTQVLGTSFNVKARPGKLADEVEVVTGRVAFSAIGKDSANNVILLPGDKAVSSQNGKVQKIRIEDQNFLAWKKEQLIFNNTPLPEVAIALENYYQQPITLANAELENCRFTGEFKKPQLKEILKVLSAATGLSYQRNKNAYLLTGKGCTL